MKSFDNCGFKFGDRVIITEDKIREFNILEHWANVRFKVIGYNKDSKHFLLYVDNLSEMPEGEYNRKKYHNVFDSYANNKLFRIDYNRLVSCEEGVIQKDLRYTRDSLIDDLLDEEV